MILKTAHKIAFARLASSFILKLRKLLGLSERFIVSRQGIRWHVDPREGFDLSILLLGSVEPAVIRAYPNLVREGDIVLDVGANIGGHTLPFARLVGPKGIVVAIEPSDWAMAKLRANVELNPALSATIRSRQVFLGDGAESTAPASKQEVYSSWPLDTSEGLHEKHLGKKTSVKLAEFGTLDSLVERDCPDRVDIIKIDVDGDEWKILRGAQHTIRSHRPLIIMELAPYLFSEEDFSQMLSFLREAGYAFYEAESGRPYPHDSEAIRRLVPEGATTNVVLRPVEKGELASLRPSRSP